jgi:S1-C subfamily serine protease
VIGKAEDKDLAVIRIEAPAGKLLPLPVGSSEDLLVGQTVLAVGNPFGLDHSLTIGVVSALGRELTAPNGRTIRDIIQTDAAINPGNSGGPLLDSRGKLVGVNSAIYSPSGASAGIGFAVPVDTVKRLVPQLISHGHAIQPGIGVSLLSDAVAQRFRLSGVVVYDVRPDGPAGRAGIEGLRQDRSGRVVLGDRIVAVNGTEIETSDDLMHLFEQAGVGATVRLLIDRNGKEREVSLKLMAIE